MKFSSMGCALLLCFAAALQALADSTPDAALDALHNAGANANSTGFIALLTEDAVVLGIDGDTRLQGQVLRDFINASFAQGKSWAYRSSERQTHVSADGAVAWFDETLERGPQQHGRGTGVLLRTREGWKIAQYTVIVPQAATSDGAPSAGTAGAPPPPPKKRCNKISFKTNTQGSC